MFSSCPGEIRRCGRGRAITAGSESSRVQTPLVSLSAIIPQVTDSHPPGSIFKSTIQGKDRGAENSRVHSGYLSGKVIRAAKCFFAESHWLEFSHMVMPSCPEDKGNVSWGMTTHICQSWSAGVPPGWVLTLGAPTSFSRDVLPTGQRGTCHTRHHQLQGEATMATRIGTYKGQSPKGLSWALTIV